MMDGGYTVSGIVVVTTGKIPDPHERRKEGRKDEVEMRDSRIENRESTIEIPDRRPAGGVTCENLPRAGQITGPPSRAAQQSPDRLASASAARCFHRTRSSCKDSAIFKNSLQRTLEAHRSENRANLIRRVPNKRSHEDTPEDAAKGEGSSGDSPTADVTWRPPSTPRSPKRKPRSVLKRNQPSHPSRPTVLPRSIQWNSDLKSGRPDQSPWLDGLDSTRSFSDGLSQLDAEICALEEYLRPTPPEEEQVYTIAADIARRLEGTVPHPLLIIGSWRTGLSMSHSDLDLLLPVPDSVRSNENIRKPSATRPKVLGLHKSLLRDVEQALRDCPSFDHHIHRSTEPDSITAIDSRTGLRLRFFCGENSPPIIEYIRDYCAEYPSLRPLYMAVRLILESQDVYGRHASSIRSEALVMLVVAFLKMNHGRFRRSDSLGERLLAFLQMYGTQVDLAKTGISVDPPGFFDADTIKTASRMYGSDDIPAHLRGQRAIINLRRTAAARGNKVAATRLCLQNPTNYMDDLGRSCIETMALQSALAGVYGRLRTALDTWERCTLGDPDCSVLNHVLHANFDDFNDVRGRLVLGGRAST
ncbi:hypothetical protein BO78DRAFT_383296 [Aspergillus sclerotiicarbonarius CBS 121057]|uniref:Polynucleotide adenylyltransferase n=1 Tax=Aspergillus sclerotiicarbonarius (strain CBS 121057 / IBT 28362) TaxID=1448318 RepID=A0A319EJM6_ASPSB|nr:hypothetical protein BO78DRAFT_383296 [Aspergillus sclerotiicarbonarius CBS 121057]